jgi:hypothetical protein
MPFATFSIVEHFYDLEESLNTAHGSAAFTLEPQDEESYKRFQEETMDLEYDTLLGFMHDPTLALPQSPILAAQALSEDMSWRMPPPPALIPSGQHDVGADSDDDMSISSSSSSYSLSEPLDGGSDDDASNLVQVDVKESSVSPLVLSSLSPRRSPSVMTGSPSCLPNIANARDPEEEYLASEDEHGGDDEFYQSDAEVQANKTARPRPRKVSKKSKRRPKSRKRSRSSTACERDDDVGLYLGPASGVREWVEALYKVGRGSEKLHVNELRRCVLCGVTSQNMRRHIQTDVKHGRLWVQKILSNDDDEELHGRELVIIIHFMISAIARLNSDRNSGFNHTWIPAQLQARTRFLQSFEDVSIASALKFQLSNNFEALREPLKHWAKFLDEERKCSSCGQPFARKDSRKRHKCALTSSSSASVSDLEDD